MSPMQEVLQRTAWIHKTGKVVAVAASTCAALVSVVTALYSYGVIGRSESHQSIGNLGAAWAGLKPAMDSASAIGDTVHYAATITDKNWATLPADTTSIIAHGLFSNVTAVYIFPPK